MIRIDKITKIFDKDILSDPITALDRLSFSIPEGKISGFLGRNGTGKTTLIRIMMDFIRANEGQVSFSEKLGRDKQEIFSKIGYLPERPSFYPYLTGLEFIEFISQLSGRNSAEIERGIYKYASRLKIKDSLNRKIGNYSKGMVQRIGFLATLVGNPTVYILDEPLSGLDPIGRKEYKDILKELKDEGKTVFFSSHIVSDVEEISDHIVLIEQGKLLYNGSLKKLREKSQEKDIRIKYVVNGDMKELVCEESEVAQKIQIILSSSHEIFEITREYQNLEEIVYNLK